MNEVKFHIQFFIQPIKHGISQTSIT